MRNIERAAKMRAFIAGLRQRPEESEEGYRERRLKEAEEFGELIAVWMEEDPD